MHLMSRSCLAAAVFVGVLTTPVCWVQAQPTGPDLMVADLWDSINNYGRVEGITAYAIGTKACNLGVEAPDDEVPWVGSTNEHPVMGTQLYRLKNGRFEQIGLSWAWHGYFAVANDFCELGCTPPDPYGESLGVGCSNPSNSNTHGAQTRLGPRGHVNAYTGDFPYHFSQVPYPPGYPAPNIGRRLQVRDRYLDPAQNEGALYFAEAHYIAADDATAGNGTNNVSYRQVTVSNPEGSVYDLTFTGSTVWETPAICAWKAEDDSVTETNVQIPNEGLFILASKATSIGSGIWRYEYALYNMNSDRSARSFSVPIPFGVWPEFVNFHDAEYHDQDGDQNSPGGFSGLDWPATIIDATSVTWETDQYDPANPQANALRWGTLYNFRFDANAEPTTGDVTIGLYKPGTPTSVTASTVVPGTPTGGGVPAVSHWGQAALILLFLAAGAIVFRQGRRARPKTIST